MKTIQSFWIGAMVVLTAMGQLSCSSSKTIAQSAQPEIVRQQIESRHYTVSVNHMSPVKGASRHLTSNYALTVKGDTVVSYLPYFGQAYNIPYGGGKGLNFESTISVYTLSYDAKGTARISFQTRSEGETLHYNIQIFSNGSSNIHVSSTNRQAINFHGNLEREDPSPKPDA